MRTDIMYAKAEGEVGPEPELQLIGKKNKGFFG